MSSYPNAFSDFWSHPLLGLESIFSGDSLVQLAPSQVLENERIQSYGIDPNTGKTFVNNISNAVDHGYNPNDPSAFLSLVRGQVDQEFAQQYQQSYDSIPLFPSLSDALNGDVSSVVFWGIAVIILVVVIVLIFKVI